MPERLITAMHHPVINGLATIMIAAVSTAIGIENIESLLNTGTVSIGGYLGGVGVILAALSKFLPALGELLVKYAEAKVRIRCADPLLYTELQQDLHELSVKYLNERCFNEDCPKRAKIRMEKLDSK